MTERTFVPQAPQDENEARFAGVKNVLLIGFGVLLALMATLCLDSLLTSKSVQLRSEAIRRDFLFREHTLDEVKSGLDASSDVLSSFDASGRNPEAIATARGQLQSIQKTTMTELHGCVNSLPSSDQQPFLRLSAELENYWRTAFPMLVADSSKSTARDLALNAAAQHAAVLALTREISSLDGSEFQKGERENADIFAIFRSRLEVVTLIALTVGLLLAVFTIIHTARLEQAAAARYREIRRAHREMRELSKQLVDAQESERQAISRELHDEVGQSLSALLMEVENLAAKPDKQDDFERAVNSVRVLALRSVEEVRNISLLLRPSMLDDLGLIPALEWQGREVGKRTGMIVDVIDKNLSENLPDEYKTCIYRVVQEALNNATKHAQAKHAKITIEQDATNIHLVIEDDGRGFDPSRTRGMGLLGMNERVARLDGNVKIDSAPGKGTRVQVSLSTPVTSLATAGEASA